MDIKVRVRYSECDPMNVAHHAVYPIWFEMARTEMLRRRGQSYADLEKRGVFFVVARLNMRFRAPARYDDQLRIHVESTLASSIKVDHRYGIYRNNDLLAEAWSTLVCVDREGLPQRLPGGAGLWKEAGTT